MENRPERKKYKRLNSIKIRNYDGGCHHDS